MSFNGEFMKRAIELAKNSVRDGTGPFGAVIVKNGEIIAEGNNQVTKNNDPSAHAEVVAIRNACQLLNSFQIDECELYTSCEPCPMCLGAIYWARPKRVYYAATKDDAARIGFDDSFIYKELQLSSNLRSIPMLLMTDMRKQANQAFDMWEQLTDKIEY